MSLYPHYREDRDNGIPHEQLADIYGSESSEYAIKYSQEQAIYADYMARQECDNRGDLDTFGGQLKAGS